MLANRSQGAVSLTFRDLFKIISRKYAITFILIISSWNFVRVPKAWLWTHVQSFSLKSPWKSTIFAIHKFGDNILESSRNISETSPRRNHFGCWASGKVSWCHHQWLLCHFVVQFHLNGGGSWLWCWWDGNVNVLHIFFNMATGRGNVTLDKVCMKRPPILLMSHSDYIPCHNTERFQYVECIYTKGEARSVIIASVNLAAACHVYHPAPRSTVTKVTVSKMAELAPSIQSKQAAVLREAIPH